jgi:uncharacterized protein with beta-barrel porin domain
MSVLHDRLTIQPDLSGQAPDDPALWMSVNRVGDYIDGQASFGSVRSKTRGAELAGGFEMTRDGDMTFGVALSSGSYTFAVPGRQTQGSMHAFHVGAYASHEWTDGLYLAGALAGDFYGNHEQRVATIPGSNSPMGPVPGFQETLNGHFDSRAISGRFEFGWRQDVGGVTLTPFVSSDFNDLDMSSFTETQAGGAPSVIGLQFPERSVASVVSQFGAQLDAKVGLGDLGQLAPFARLSWRHEFEPQRTLAPSFIAAPGFDFLVDGPRALTDAADFRAGLSLQLLPNLGAFVSTEDVFANRSLVYSASIGVRASW